MSKERSIIVPNCTLNEQTIKNKTLPCCYQLNTKFDHRTATVQHVCVPVWDVEGA